ncbi:MAG: PspC domain-containing protein [Acidimicrobiia bacterium]|nr:PspC domain-containing protein [Acidimicrobiia bacterium]
MAVQSTGTSEAKTETRAKPKRLSADFSRSTTDRWLAGVCGGIAHRLGIESMYVRVAFLIFTLASGIGFFAYVLALVLTIDQTEEHDPESFESASTREKVALLLMGAGALGFSNELGLVPTFIYPVALVLLGGAALWDRSQSTGDSRLARLIAPGVGGAPTLGRTVGGLILLIVGLGMFFSEVSFLRQAGTLVNGVVITGVGAAVVFGPWLYRLARELSAERSERIRADARAEFAAHLHDSVLQTLALIQRSPDDPRKMVTLARSQERELRNWLYRAGSDHEELGPALEELAAIVEQNHDVPIEVIVVGSAPLDVRVEALLGAAREAMTNAAKHSGADTITVYAEVEPDAIDVWVTDQGSGFDVSASQSNGAGISGSIIGRMERHGGTAELASGEEGTEVPLRLPRSDDER